MNRVRIWRYLISFLVIASLAINVFLIYLLLHVEQGFTASLEAARETLLEMSNAPLAVTVEVDQMIPVHTTVAFSDTLTVPVRFEYPLDTVVNTYIQLPVLGRQDIVVPVQTVIPISQTFEMPVQMQVPISITYPLQAEIPVQVEIPHQLAETLHNFLDGLEQGMRLPFR
ncbi:MAG: hypothetical protein ACP5HG_12975 [Anaerolineae bacterium]